MSNYYEETMPLFTDKDEYLKYYFEESLPIFDKLNIIIKKGQPFQRQALIKNLIVYEKEPLFKSLINFIIDDIPTWDAETVLLLPKTLYLLIINTDYVLENDLFNLIFKHMIISVSTGAEKNKNEYTYYFNKIIEFYSIIDINNNNKIKKNFFPYTISDEIIELIVSFGKFGQTSVNRKLCLYLSSSLCRIMVKLDGDNNLNTISIKRLYTRINYLFCDGEKIIESQMVRELLYIIPIFKDVMFTNEDITQAIERYINHDIDHVIQVMAIISVLKNIIYLNKESNIINILLNKIKEISEDSDYEQIYKNAILHILINEMYNNYLSLNPAFIYQAFQLGIMKNYYNFYKLDILFIKNFDKYYFLINYFLDNAQYLENKFNENNDKSLENNDTIGYDKLVESIQTTLNFEEYFIKIYNELFLTKDNNNESNDVNANARENGEEYLDEENKSKEMLLGNYTINTKINKNKKNFDNLLYEKHFFEQNLDLIFNKKIVNGELYNNLYSKELMKKTLYIYIPKIIACFPNLKSNKCLCDKISSLFDKTNIILMMNIYSLSIKYIMDNHHKDKNLDKNDNKKMKKIPLYELFLFLLKKNLKLFLQQGKSTNKSNNNKEPPYFEGNIYNKLIVLILTNTNLIYQESPHLIRNGEHLLIGEMLKLLMPKFYKYYKNITYNAVVNNQNNNSNNINNSFNNNKETIKVCYFEKIYEEIFYKLISKIIINNKLGHHIIKEYVEIIPYFILFSKNRWKYYDFFIKEIFSSDSFYKRKYSIIFYNQCFKVFSFGFICKNGLLNDFIILMKDKVNLISTKAIELIYIYSKKIISYSTKKFQELCNILNEIYELNIKAFNENENKDKKKEIIFDKEKNIIINKIISINNNVNKYYTDEEISKEKEIENKLFMNEIEIFKLDKSANNKNKSKIKIDSNFTFINNNSNTNNINSNNLINSNNNIIEYNKVSSNILQLSSSNFQNNKNNNIYSSVFSAHKLIGTMINNKNSLNLFTSSQKEKGQKISPWIEKSSSGLFKDRKRKNSNSKISIGNFNKDNKLINNEANNIYNNSRYHSTSKNFKPYNKHYLPKLNGLKINRKDLNNINNNNVRSIDITFNKVNTKIDDNEEQNFTNHNKINRNNNTNIFNKNDLRLISFTQNRIPSAKIKIMNSYPIISREDNPNLNLKDYDNEKKISSNNHSNLGYNYVFNNNNGNNNYLNMKSISNKHINMTLRPKSKNVKLRRDSFVPGKHKIYIDANK